MKSKMLLAVILGMLCYAASLPVTFAQGAGSGTILGVVHDPSGAVVPGATVTIRDTAKNLVVRTLTTSPEGRYVAPFLAPSNYEITVNQPGFAKLVRAGIDLRVGDSLEINLSLQLSSGTQVVTVTEAAPVLETTKTEHSQTVGSVMVENLPINGRRWDNFVLLTPGVTTDGGFGLVSYRGISGIYNDNKVDGADNNQAFFSEARGRTRIAYTYSMDAIKEFQVKSSNYDAEYGAAAGGVVNAVTKSGTNTWHGDMFYYLRHFNLNALDSVAKSRGSTVKPEKLRHQYGGSLGGPIKTDKLFFFGNYDGQRRTFPLTVISSSSNFFTGSATNCPVQATAQQCAAAKGFLQSLTGSFPRRGDQDVWFGKLDYVINDNNRVSGSLNWHNWRSPNGILTGVTTTSSLLATGGDYVRDRFAVINLSSAIRNNLANEFRFQYGKDFEFENSNFGGPNVFMTGGVAYGEPNFLPRPQFPNEKRLQFSDNFSIVTGRHTIRTGVDFNAIHEILENLFQGGGVYSYSNYQNWVLDVFNINTGTSTGKHYSSFAQAADPITGTGKDDFWNNDYAFYVQDSWQMTPKLTVNAGLRWEVQTVPQPPKPNTATPLLSLYTSTINIDKNNFGPRVGLAWQPMSKTVVRAGYGLFYGKTTNSSFYTIRVENGIYQQTFSCRSNSSCAPIFPNVIFTPPGPPLQAPFTGAVAPQVVNTNPPATAQLARGLTPDFVNPMVHEGELGVERELPYNLTLSATYLFSRGQRLPVFIDTNLARATGTKTYDVTDSTGNTLQSVTVPFYTTRVDTGTGVILTGESVLNSWYHALVVSAQKRYSHGLAVMANFTLSKTTDNGEVLGTNGTFNGTDVPLDPYNQKLEYGLSDLDQRKRFVASVVYGPQLGDSQNQTLRTAVNGFKLSTIVTLAGGRPITGFVNSAPFGGPDFGVTGGEVSANGGFTGGRVPYVGRNTITGPSLKVIDFRIARDFRFHERFGIEVLAEAFNLFNHTNITDVATTAVNFTSRSGTSTTCNSGIHANDCLVARTDFLSPQASGNTLYGARQMQVSMRITF